MVAVPIGIVPQQFDVQPVQPPGRLDVERVLADLANGRDAGQFQEVPEVIIEFRELTNQRRFVGIQLLGMNDSAIGHQHELGFVLGRRRRVGQPLHRFIDQVGLATDAVRQ
ncbi:hypothetical protein Pla100_03050 [Neorhodopirellula pilleata]|uniref:Uncharacterized protein n=1 Tax=Neorhodopirellula pilleata TaxID=2714738 RepID=A0A5C6AZ14_9BACT|nr:hypothetical protein Pla100_03050 [Neorhodopirellula pilleata]